MTEYRTMTQNEIKEKYRNLAKVDESVQLVVLECESDKSTVVGQILDGQYCAPWYRFYTDNKIERGMLWGGDVWEAN